MIIVCVPKSPGLIHVEVLVTSENIQRVSQAKFSFSTCKCFIHVIFT